jgi:SRSO17 transposase
MSKRSRPIARRRRCKVPPSGRKSSGRLREVNLVTARQMLVDFHQLFARHFRRAEQRCWSAFYLCGQLARLGRKTIEPMVLELLGRAPELIRAVQQFIGQSPWAMEPLIEQLEALVAQTLNDLAGVIIADGSGFPKRGRHSAGVAWQSCGRSGKVDNCQEGVFLVYASPKGHAVLNGRLYLPADWFAPDQADRWKACGIPAPVRFQTEPEIALDLLRQVRDRGQVTFRWVTADADFGRDSGFWTVSPRWASGTWPRFPRARACGCARRGCNPPDPA